MRLYRLDHASILVHCKLSWLLLLQIIHKTIKKDEEIKLYSIDTIIHLQILKENIVVQIWLMKILHFYFHHSRISNLPGYGKAVMVAT